ncbi:MAG: hypothetical protein ACREOB_01370, partial [Thermodesulfobacteriota bacterium]
MNPQKLTQNIETDSFDKELFEELAATSEELNRLIESGSHLLPNFRYFVLDLFASFFKYNVILYPQAEVRSNAFVCRKLLEKALSSDIYRELRDETILDGFNAAIATVTVGTALINWIKSEDGLSQSTLLKEWELHKVAEDYEELEEEAETWKEMEKEKSLDKSFKEGKKKAQFELRKKGEELKDLDNEQKERLDKSDMKLHKLTK